MTGKRIYLEAPARTQRVLDARTALLAAGVCVGSTWHNDGVTADPAISERTWIQERLDELSLCDALIVLCEDDRKTPLQVPFLVGSALARGLDVVCIGLSIRLTGFRRNMHRFDTIEEFCNSFGLASAA